MPGNRPYLLLLVLFAVATPRVAHASGSWAVPRFTPTWAELEADLKALGVKKPPPKRPTLVARAHVPEKPSGPATDAVAAVAKPTSDKPTVDNAAAHPGTPTADAAKPGAPSGPGIDAYLNKPGQNGAACVCPPVPVCEPPSVLVPPGGSPTIKPTPVSAPADGAAKPTGKKKTTTRKKKKSEPEDKGSKKLEHKKYWWE